MPWLFTADDVRSIALNLAASLVLVIVGDGLLRMLLGFAIGPSARLRLRPAPNQNLADLDWLHVLVENTGLPLAPKTRAARRVLVTGAIDGTACSLLWATTAQRPEEQLDIHRGHLRLVPLVVRARAAEAGVLYGNVIQPGIAYVTDAEFLTQGHSEKLASWPLGSGEHRVEVTAQSEDGTRRSRRFVLLVRPWPAAMQLAEEPRRGFLRMVGNGTGTVARLLVLEPVALPLYAATLFVIECMYGLYYLFPDVFQSGLIYFNLLRNTTSFSALGFPLIALPYVMVATMHVLACRLIRHRSTGRRTWPARAAFSLLLPQVALVSGALFVPMSRTLFLINAYLGVAVAWAYYYVSTAEEKPKTPDLPRLLGQIAWSYGVTGALFFFFPEPARMRDIAQGSGSFNFFYFTAGQFALVATTLAYGVMLWHWLVLTEWEVERGRGPALMSPSSPRP